MTKTITIKLLFTESTSRPSSKRSLHQRVPLGDDHDYQQGDVVRRREVVQQEGAARVHGQEHRPVHQFG
jgi:hypothetical protein